MKATPLLLALTLLAATSCAASAFSGVLGRHPGGQPFKHGYGYGGAWLVPDEPPPVVEPLAAPPVEFNYVEAPAFVPAYPPPPPVDYVPPARPRARGPHILYIGKPGKPTKSAGPVILYGGG